jgi:hypothetical protein
MPPVKLTWRKEANVRPVVLKVRQVFLLAVQIGNEISNGHVICENVTISLCRDLRIFRIL